MHYVDDAVGTCAFLSSFRGQFGGRPPYHIYNLPGFINAAAGMELSPETLWEAALRSRTLVRALNVRRGMRRKDEKPPEDHWQIRHPEIEQQLRDAYYVHKGWNNDGVPTRATLEALGLDDVAQDFVERGILTGEDAQRGQTTLASRP